MKTVRCVCGAEILVVADVQEMAKAIRGHAAKHWNSKAVLDDLTKQLLKVVSEA